jgi:transcription termination/antitermination protein NusA
LEKIIDIIDSIAYEKGLQIEEVKDAVSQAVIRTAQRSIDETLEYDVEIDEKNKTLNLFQKILVCAHDDERVLREDDNYISLEEAQDIDPDVEVGDELRYALSLENMTRTAANILHKNLEFQIQRLVENQLFSKYKARVGQIISGPVVRVDEEQNTYVEIDEIRAVMPRKNRIKGEKYAVGQTVQAVLRYVGMSKTEGMVIELSRTTPKYLEELLRLEVPEINDGDVIIERCARIPGERAKIAINSINPRIDPVGATVGVKGVRINAVSNELNGENIDCIEFSPIAEMFVLRALSPAVISSVKIEDGKAMVTISSDQKPKAIGKNGINIRLASMLTGFEIELVELVGSGSLDTSQTKEGETSTQNREASSLMSLFKE